jgi:hypothetical protein
MPGNRMAAGLYENGASLDRLVDVDLFKLYNDA